MALPNVGMAFNNIHFPSFVACKVLCSLSVKIIIQPRLGNIAASGSNLQAVAVASTDSSGCPTMVGWYQTLYVVWMKQAMLFYLLLCYSLPVSQRLEANYTV